MMAMRKLPRTRPFKRCTQSVCELAWQPTGQLGILIKLTVLRSPAGAGADQPIRVARRSAAASAEAGRADAAGIAAGMLCLLCFSCRLLQCQTAFLCIGMLNVHEDRAHGKTSQIQLGGLGP